MKDNYHLTRPEAEAKLEDLRARLKAAHEDLDELTSRGVTSVYNEERKAADRRRADIEREIGEIRRSGVIPWMHDDLATANARDDDEIWVTRVIGRRWVEDENAEFRSEDTKLLNLFLPNNRVTLTREQAWDLVKQLQSELIKWEVS